MGPKAGTWGVFLCYIFLTHIAVCKFKEKMSRFPGSVQHTRVHHRPVAPASENYFKSEGNILENFSGECAEITMATCPRL